MKTLSSIIFVSCFAFHLNADPLTNGQTVAWNAGVRGGIPYYPNAVSVSDYGADNTGTTDSYGAFTNAIAHCTNGGAVYVPPGTYRIDSIINPAVTKQIVLRGQSPTNTVLEMRTTSGSLHGAITFGGDSSRNTPMVTNGYTAGSSNLIVTSTSGISVGHLALLRQSNDAAYVFGTLSDANNLWQGQMARVHAVSGNTVTLDRPLYFSYGPTSIMDFRAYSKAAEFCGLENLTIKGWVTNSSPQNLVAFFIAQNCWVTNCVVTNSYYSNVEMNQAYAIEVRGSRMENHQAYDSNTRYGAQMDYWSTDCLIEDNIVNGHNLSIVCQQGACGNVISANFALYGFGNGYPTDAGAKGWITMHGDNANFNLVEHNVAPAGGADCFWGSNRKNTFHRNHFMRWGYVSPPPTNTVMQQGMYAISLEATNYYHNFVGNIFGTPRDTGDAVASHYALNIGYDSRQGNEYPASPKDTNSLYTATFIGNYDFQTNGTHWPGGIVALESSYHRTSKPSWFGSLAWPPIGPDVNTTATITNSAVIPAQARFLGQDYTTVFVTNNASGARVMGFRGLGMSVLPPLASPYLLEQGFEGTSYDNSQTWAEVGSATLNEDYTSTVLVGSQSMLIDLTSNTGDTTSPLISMPSGGGNIWYVYFQLRVLTFPSSGFRVATVTNSFDLSINASSNLVIRPQVGTGVATVGKLEAGTTYHVWMQGSGNDIETAGAGTARVGFSTTGIRPTSGDNYAIDTDVSANSPFTTVQLVLGSRQVSANYSVIIDKVRVDNDVIGDNPQ